jgi:hypothetical protein
MNTVLIKGILILALSQLAPAEEVGLVVEREAGLVARQLMEYTWQPVSSDTQAPTNAIERSFEWMQKCLTREYAPTPDAIVEIHRRDHQSCDAIRLKYQRATNQIVIAQTIMTVLMVFQGPYANIADLREAEVVANRLASTVLVRVWDYRLETVELLPKLAVGRPAKPTSEFPKGYKPPHITVARWWADGERVFFYGAKIPGAESPELIPVSIGIGLEENQRWFDLSSRKRSQ